MTDGSVQVVIDEVVKYGRVSDGYAPTRIGPFRLKPGMSVDLDGGDYVPLPGDLATTQEKKNEPDTGDLQYDGNADGGVLKAVNGAAVAFPLETLCRQDQG